MRKLALKRLTASDLTFFQWHYKNHSAGNQKSINLNSDIFIDCLYPSLPDLITAQDGRIPLDLFIYGPGIRGEYNLQRKIVKQPSYKNYRLNGEFVFNPDEDPQRFNIIRPSDIVIFEFIGEITPKRAKMILLAQDETNDFTLFRVFDTLLGSQKMVSLTEFELTKAIADANPSGSHPINELTLIADLEDASKGGDYGIRRLMLRPSGRRVSRSDLYRARENADRIGDLGETFVGIFLSSLQSKDEIREFARESVNNAIAPYDFDLVQADGEPVLVDAKSTEGEFDRIIHISINELRQMASGPSRYDIYRIYEMTQDQAKLKIVRNMKEFAEKILAIMAQLPEGVSSDGIAIRPSVLPFETEEYIIHFADEDAITES